MNGSQLEGRAMEVREDNGGFKRSEYPPQRQYDNRRRSPSPRNRSISPRRPRSISPRRRSNSRDRGARNEQRVKMVGLGRNDRSPVYDDRANGKDIELYD